MTDRKPTPESELLDDLKRASLEAASQVLSGVSLARKLTDSVRERYTGRIEQRLGLDPNRPTSLLGDLILRGARLQMEQARAALGFQRWVSDTIYQGMQRTVDASAADPSCSARQRIPVQGARGATVVVTLDVHNTENRALPVRGYTQVTLRPGSRAYLAWGADGVAPVELAPNARVQVRVPIVLAQAALTPGSYDAVTVIQLGDQRQQFDLALTITP